jgi:hypothetical protein
MKTLSQVVKIMGFWQFLKTQFILSRYSKFEKSKTFSNESKMHSSNLQQIISAAL